MATYPHRPTTTIATTSPTKATNHSTSSTYAPSSNHHQLFSPSSSTSIPPSPSQALSTSPFSPDKRRRIVIGGQVGKRVGAFSPTLQEDDTSGGVFGVRVTPTDKIKVTLERSDSMESNGSGSRQGGPRAAGASPAIRRKAAAYEQHHLQEASTTLPLRVINRSTPSSVVSSGSAVAPYSIGQNAARFTPSKPSREASSDSASSNYATPTASPTKASSLQIQQQDPYRTPQKTTPQSLHPPLSAFSSSHVPTLGSPSTAAVTTAKNLISQFESPRAVPPTARATPTRSTHLNKPLPPLSIPSPSFAYADSHSPSHQQQQQPRSPNGLAASGRSPSKSPLREGFKKLVGKFGAKGRRRRKGSRGDWSCSGEEDEGQPTWAPEVKEKAPLVSTSPVKRFWGASDEMQGLGHGKGSGWVDMSQTIVKRPGDLPGDREPLGTTAAAAAVTVSMWWRPRAQNMHVSHDELM